MGDLVPCPWESEFSLKEELSDFWLTETKFIKSEPTMDDPVGAIPSDKLQMAPTPIMVDNFGTTKTANNPVSSTQGSKHIDVRYFRVRDFIKNKLLRVIFCRTNVNIADFFTKGLPTTTFQSFKSKLMGCVETF